MRHGIPIRPNGVGSAIDRAVEEKRPALVAAIENSLRRTAEWLLEQYGPQLRGPPSIFNSKHYSTYVETVRPVLSEVPLPPHPGNTATMEEKQAYWALERMPRTHYVDDAKVRTVADRKAGLVLKELREKLEQKLVELDDAKARGLDGVDFEITGTRAGHKVHIHQTMILNVSSKGKLFNQFPALIYVDGKKTSEKKYKEMLAALPKPNPGVRRGDGYYDLTSHDGRLYRAERILVGPDRGRWKLRAHYGLPGEEWGEPAVFDSLTAIKDHLGTRSNPWVHEMDDRWTSWRVADGPHAGFEFSARDESAALDYVRSRGLGSRVQPAYELRVLANPSFYPAEGGSKKESWKITSIFPVEGRADTYRIEVQRARSGFLSRTRYPNGQISSGMADIARDEAAWLSKEVDKYLKRGGTSVKANRGRQGKSSKAVDEIVERFKSRHWGHEADRIIDQPDPDLPDYLVQMGVLVHIELGSRRSSDHVDIDFTKDWKGPEAGQAHLCFAVTKDERLYVLLTPAIEAQVRKHLLEPALRGGAKYRTLTEIARIAGGRQARFTYSKVRAVALGHVYRLIYYTKKIEGPGYEGQGGVALFDHQVAEEGGYFPILAADEKGRLWLCGGSYSVPAGGIKN